MFHFNAHIEVRHAIYYVRIEYARSMEDARFIYMNI